MEGSSECIRSTLWKDKNHWFRVVRTINKQPKVTSEDSQIVRPHQLVVFCSGTGKILVDQRCERRRTIGYSGWKSTVRPDALVDISLLSSRPRWIPLTTESLAGRTGERQKGKEYLCSRILCMQLQTDYNTGCEVGTIKGSCVCNFNLFSNQFHTLYRDHLPPSIELLCNFSIP